MPTGATSGSNDELCPGPFCATGLRGDAWTHPFAWQDGRRLWILDSGPDEWILAELRFEPRECRYFEVRRATYRWFREAAGALLGRALSGGLPHAEAAASGLSAWAVRNHTR